jgi:hypothetical protein
MYGDRVGAVAQTALHVLAGDGEALWFTGNRITVKVTAETSGGAFGMWEALAPPRRLTGAAPPPP